VRHGIFAVVESVDRVVGVDRKEQGEERCPARRIKARAIGSEQPLPLEEGQDRRSRTRPGAYREAVDWFRKQDEGAGDQGIMFGYPAWRREPDPAPIYTPTSGS